MIIQLLECHSNGLGVKVESGVHTSKDMLLVDCNCNSIVKV